jgi:hypothetical protein
MPAKWLLSAARIAIFDIAGPLITYSVLRSAGEGAVASLVMAQHPTEQPPAFRCSRG